MPESKNTPDLQNFYMSQIRGIEEALLKPQDEVDLAKQIEAGLYAEHLLELSEYDEDPDLLEAIAKDGQLAKRRFEKANMRLIISTTGKYFRGRVLLGMDQTDLYQEGYFGLVRAIEKFDYTKGYKFSTYATWWIRSYISRAIANQNQSKRLPVHVSERVNKMFKIKNQLEKEYGREPTNDELAAEMDMTLDELEKLILDSQDAISLNMQMGEDGDGEIGDLIGANEDFTDEVERVFLADLLDDALCNLPPSQERVIRMIHGIGCEPVKIKAIAKLLRMADARVRQSEAEGFANIRKTYPELALYLP
ncbi:MAG TPA: sigma-70 family RNA polymerase sigma factor [Candidatus Saccharimonadales bacterium]|nr:sigma-70 family RNA polymerase sigma factor [Candidatus Saccharimonadales bacterium]